MHQIELFEKYPHDVQNEWLQKLLVDAKDTEFGKRHHFGSIHNYEQFKRNIPLQDYESLKPFIERTRRGEQNQMFLKYLRCNLNFHHLKYRFQYL